MSRACDCAAAAAPLLLLSPTHSPLPLSRYVATRFQQLAFRVIISQAVFAEAVLALGYLNGFRKFFSAALVTGASVSASCCLCLFLAVPRTVKQAYPLTPPVSTRSLSLLAQGPTTPTSTTSSRSCTRNRAGHL